jgi:glucosylglycerate synthase
MYESSLGDDARRQLMEIGGADVVVGIPSHRNARTIGEVVRAVAEGVTVYLPNQRVVLMNADGGSSDNTSRYLADASVGANVERFIVIYEGSMGKGVAIRSIFEAAAALDAKACVVVEARAPGIVPEWIPALVNPIMSGSDMVLGCYRRSAHAAALTDNLAYPFLRTFFNADIREPLASEFALSGALAGELANRDVWETDVARFGINIWLTVQGLVEERRMAQVDLGYRGEGGGEPGAPGDARFTHMVGTLFRTLTIHRRIWQRNLPPRRPTFHGGRSPDVAVPCGNCDAPIAATALVQGLFSARKEHTAEWERSLSPAAMQAVNALFEQPVDTFRFPIDLWARVVADFGLSYNKGDGDPDKVSEALLPLFYGRAGSYIRETDGMTVVERETVVRQIVQAFLALKPYFVEQWDNYQPWVDSLGYGLGL